MVSCPICRKSVRESLINQHIDSGCTENIFTENTSSPTNANGVSTFFQPPSKTKSQQQQPHQPPLQSIAPQQQQHHLKRPHNISEPNDPDQPHEPKRPKLSSSNGGPAKTAPLAERMRPTTLDDVLGQDLVGPSGLLRALLAAGRAPSLILWGGPGTGKTTIARLVAQAVGARLVEVNATASGVAELKTLFATARSELQLTGRQTVLFADEIHRFSRTQQDVFLAPVESGQVVLVGATTENPSFKVTGALLSRCRVFTLSPLSEATLVGLMRRALQHELGPGVEPPRLIDEGLFAYLARAAAGDARAALTLLELALSTAQARPDTSEADLKRSLTKTFVHDRAGDAHYDTISALHKSIRGSDPDASLFYLGRMLAGGDDPLFIARRLIVVASEDVGLADNTLLPLAIATHDAVMKVGLPEARINLAHCVCALALAKKSTRSYRALAAVEKTLKEGGEGMHVPLHLRSAPTRLMKEIGYGKGYKYNPDYVDGRVKQDYLPEGLKGKRFLEDRDLGTEIDSDLEHDTP